MISVLVDQEIKRIVGANYERAQDPGRVQGGPD